MSTDTAIATVKPAPTKLIVSDDSQNSAILDTGRFEQLQRVCRLIAGSTLTPKHLRGQNIDEGMANCFRVVNQALRWGLDPFAVVDETYVVQGKLAYQGKLVAAVVNTRAGLVGRLRYEFTGQGDGRTIKVIGQFQGEDEPRDVLLSVKQAKTNNAMWVNDSDQKLIYSGVIRWARRHCPEIILGVATDDDLDRIASGAPEAHLATSHAREAEVMRDLEAGKAKAIETLRAKMDEPKPAVVDLPEHFHEVESQEPDEPTEAELSQEEPLNGMPDFAGEIQRCKSRSELEALDARYIEEGINRSIVGPLVMARAAELSRKKKGQLIDDPNANPMA